MIPLDNPQKHACYVMDLIFQRRDRQFWNGLFDAARNHILEGRWDEARECLRRALAIGGKVRQEREANLMRQRAGFDLLMGACYVGSSELDQALHHYEYAASTFVEGADDYGHSIFLYAKALALHAKKDWLLAYDAYKQALRYLQKPIVYDVEMRHMRVDLEICLAQVEQAIFAEVRTPATAAPRAADMPKPAVVDTANDDAADKGEPESKLSAKPMKPQNSAPPPMRADYAAAEGFLSLFPYFQRVAAGPGIWVQDGKQFEDYLEIDQVLVKGKRYCIKPITKSGSKVLQIIPANKYGVVRIDGDSMLDAEIVHDEYVLIEELHMLPNPAYNKQILCVVVDEDGKKKAMIKRFHVDGPLVLLHSENKSGLYPPLSYHVANVEILGKVVAILKKIE